MDFFRTLTLAGVVVVSGVAAQAATVTINVSSTAIDVECDGSATQPCYGLVGGSWDATGDPASLNLTNADLYPVTSSTLSSRRHCAPVTLMVWSSTETVGGVLPRVVRVKSSQSLQSVPS